MYFRSAIPQSKLKPAQHRRLSFELAIRPSRQEGAMKASRWREVFVAIRRVPCCRDIPAVRWLPSRKANREKGEEVEGECGLDDDVVRNVNEDGVFGRRPLALSKEEVEELWNRGGDDMNQARCGCPVGVDRFCLQWSRNGQKYSTVHGVIDGFDTAVFSSTTGHRSPAPVQPLSSPLPPASAEKDFKYPDSFDIQDAWDTNEERLRRGLERESKIRHSDWVSRGTITSYEDEEKRQEGSHSTTTTTASVAFRVPAKRQLVMLKACFPETSVTNNQMRKVKDRRGEGRPPKAAVEEDEERRDAEDLRSERESWESNQYFSLLLCVSRDFGSPQTSSTVVTAIPPNHSLGDIAGSGSLANPSLMHPRQLRLSKGEWTPHERPGAVQTAPISTPLVSLPINRFSRVSAPHSPSPPQVPQTCDSSKEKFGHGYESAALIRLLLPPGQGYTSDQLSFGAFSLTSRESWVTALANGRCRRLLRSSRQSLMLRTITSGLLKKTIHVCVKTIENSLLDHRSSGQLDGTKGEGIKGCIDAHSASRRTRQSDHDLRIHQPRTSTTIATPGPPPAASSSRCYKATRKLGLPSSESLKELRKWIFHPVALPYSRIEQSMKDRRWVARLSMLSWVMQTRADRDQLVAPPNGDPPHHIGAQSGNPLNVMCALATLLHLIHFIYPPHVYAAQEMPLSVRERHGQDIVIFDELKNITLIRCRQRTQELLYFYKLNSKPAICHIIYPTFATSVFSLLIALSSSVYEALPQMHTYIAMSHSGKNIILAVSRRKEPRDRCNLESV
ncbi:hypothetical protein BKA70DRAFT_1401128 [Coprinopsis sp. MPI-PUGE-AT-0042]|nr:hypothetical protein BKA70DRAFT_1401128 [Coprinopsis sp. MPI-PUGE-AT-0042]